MLSGVYYLAVFVFTCEIGLVFLQCTLDLFSERIDKIRGKTHSTSSRCAACKFNTVERSDDLPNNVTYGQSPLSEIC